MPADRLVMVTWSDAHGHDGYYDADADHKPVKMFTIGWLVKEDASGISLACERHKEGRVWRYRGGTFIPAGMIVKVGEP